MKRFKLTVLAFGFFSVFFLMGNSGGCGGAITPAVISGGIATVNSIIELLKPAVDTAQALCEELTKDTSEVRAAARFECASINDAWSQAQAMATTLQTAVTVLEAALKTGDQAKITEATAARDKAQADFDLSVKELRSVLAKSPTVIKRK